MYGDHVKYLSFIDDTPLFNKEGFFNSKQKQDQPFYAELTETQMFNQLVDNKNLKETLKYFYKENSKFLEYQDNYLLDQSSNLNQLCLENFVKTSYSRKSSMEVKIDEKSLHKNSLLEVQKNEVAVLKPYFLEEFNYCNDKSKIDEVVKNKYEKEESLGFIMTKSLCPVTEELQSGEYNYYKYILEEDSNIKSSISLSLGTDDYSKSRPRCRKSTLKNYSS